MKNLSKGRVILIVVGLLFACGIIGSLLPKTDNTASNIKATPTLSAAGKVLDILDTPVPKPTKAPTFTPVPALPTATRTLEESLLATLPASLGRRAKITHADQSEISISFDIADNLTSNMIKDGAKLDIFEALKALKEAGVEVGSVTFYGDFPMQDQYGNSANTTVVIATYSHDTYYVKLNYRNFLWKNIYNVADKVQLHSQFK